MTLIIAILMVAALVLIAFSPLTSVNKAAVAMFAGTLGWVLYVCFGSDFVLAQHPADYLDFLSGTKANSIAVKEYIASNIFIRYVGKASEIVLFLIATMTIVEILDSNGCFDFIPQWIKTRHSRRLLWTTALLTLLISANLDNLTTTMMMLLLMHKILPDRRHRAVFGSVIVLSANIGGALTVIGDYNGLLLWNMGAVTPSHFSAWMALPCLVAWAVPTALMARKLPERVTLENMTLPYRGDDTNLTLWQRIALFFFSLGGLWFIPTFHDITKLSPFLGALCVLSVLWIVNEIFNRRLMDVDKMIERRVPRQLQYGVIQMMLFVIGMMLAVAVARETGVLGEVSSWCDNHLNSVWLIGILAGAVSCVVDTFASAMTFCSFHNVGVGDYAQNGAFWKVIAFCTTVGGNVLGIGSMSGLAFLKMERMHVGWYFRNIGWKALVGGIAGLALLALTMYLQN